MTDALKQAIADSGETFTELERATGVKRASLLRFMRGETSLRLDMADRLATHFKIGVSREQEGR